MSLPPPDGVKHPLAEPRVAGRTRERRASQLMSPGSSVPVDARASAERIIIGWGLGIAVAIPVGLLMGRISLARRVLEPYIELFRFIPPTAFVRSRSCG